MILLTRGGKTRSRFLKALSVEEVQEKRTAEFLMALEKLGIPEENIFIYIGRSKLKTEEILEIMRVVAEKLPESAHRTTSIYDPHFEHQNAAEALVKLFPEYEGALDIEFYRVYQYMFTPRITFGKSLMDKVKVPDSEIKKDALKVYLNGIAGVSVPILLITL